MEKVKPKPGFVVAVDVLPRCDFCGDTARFDFATKHGPWANACPAHYAVHRATDSLGVGKGQALITHEEAE